ncbi:hypothetical protein B0J15DRAFT_170424 [Fusarium solani]|uniref:Uncharacterized protein n=1 Tax=Fusarium solani TaxID=169388 RepID=A0A9P9RB10_FUSSL|nr:uncharacterized protein B0J15DRAFT_170424 [Fusarium solani]KAH7272214.1 hypothetical protein B0J15DRAFT_170424 [Fusarium solani]
MPRINQQNSRLTHTPASRRVRSVTAASMALLLLDQPEDYQPPCRRSSPYRTHNKRIDRLLLLLPLLQLYLAAGGTKVYFRRARNKVEPSCQANRVDPNLASWEPLCRHGLAANLWARCGWQWLWFTLVEGGGGMRSLLAQAFLTKKEEGGTPSF